MKFKQQATVDTEPFLISKKMEQEELIRKLKSGETKFRIEEISGLDLSQCEVKINDTFVSLSLKKVLSLYQFNLYNWAFTAESAWESIVKDIHSRPNFYIENIPTHDSLSSK